jgi:hypothetical protein
MDIIRFIFAIILALTMMIVLLFLVKEDLKQKGKKNLQY